MLTNKPARFGSAIAASAGLLLGLTAIAGASPASAVTTNTWSDATTIATAGPAGMTGTGVELDDGSQWVVSSARSDGNTMGLLAAVKPSGGSFAPPSWLVNPPGSADSARNVDTGLTVLTDGTDIVVGWQANADNGGGTFRLAAIRYDGGSQTWSTPAYRDFSTTTSQPVGSANFVLLANGDLLAAYGDGSANMFSALFTTSSATWGPNVAVGVQMDLSSYYAPNLAATSDGSAWMSFNAENTPMAVKWTAGNWGSAEPVRGANPNTDFDAGNDDQSALALVPVGAGQQPAVVYGMSGNGSTEIAIRSAAGVWTRHVVTSTNIANAFLAFGADAGGGAAVAMWDYNNTDPIWTTSTDGGVTWSTATSFTVTGLFIYGGRFVATPEGDVAVTLPATSSTPTPHGLLYLVVHRAGSTGFTEPTLISTETADSDNQGAASANVSFSSTTMSMQTVWTSWANSGQSSYSLFTRDVGSLFPLPGFAPHAPSITGLEAGPQTVRVSVKRAARGSAPSSFIVTAHPGDATCTVTSTTGGSCLIDGLQNGRSYTFTAVARNSIGMSPASSPAGPAFPGDPVAPTVQSIPRILPAGDSYASDNGTGIRVDVSPNSTDTGVIVSGEGFTMALRGLNAKGDPAGLNPSGAITLGNGRQVQTSGSGFMPDSKVNLYMEPPVSATRSTRAKTIYVGSLRTDASGAFSGRTALPRSLTLGLHDLQVVGVTTANTLRALTLGVLVASPPSKVRNLTATLSPATATAILTWASPASANGGAITGYVAKYKLVPGGTWTRVTVANPTLLIGGLTIGCVYRAKVAAVNSAGVGTWTGVNFTATGVLGHTPRGDLCLPQ